MALPVAAEASTAPVPSKISAPDPAVVLTVRRPVAAIEPRVSDWELLNVKEVKVPLAVMPPTRLLPVRLTVPAPPYVSVAAVMTPVPDSVAPAATTVAAEPEPRDHDPARSSVPAATVVAPAWVSVPARVIVLVAEVASDPAPETVPEIRPEPLVAPRASVPELMTIAPDRSSAVGAAEFAALSEMLTAPDVVRAPLLS